MAKIVMVHGAFNELWGPHELKARWLPALRDGLWHHGVEIDDVDLAVCFYGDLFRRRPGTESEAQLARSRAGVADSLEELMGEDALDALQQAAGKAVFDRTVDMVTVMLTDANLRAELRNRIEAVVDDGTRVLVAHSFGTVLSYMALCNHPQWSIDTFVTVGSPLAHPMIFGSLDPPPVSGRRAWPGSVQRWVNVRAVGDKAAEIPVSTSFGSNVEDVLIDNGHRAHAPEPYLNAFQTGAAIADAIRG
jgi:hypothetical protein